MQRAKYKSVNIKKMMTVEIFFLSFGFVVLTCEAFSKVTFDM
jgi:hypothetical protein